MKGITDRLLALAHSINPRAEAENIVQLHQHILRELELAEGASDRVESELCFLGRDLVHEASSVCHASQDAALLDRISTALWARADSFLAHGRAGGQDDARQPILLSDKLEAANGAAYVMLADGIWREGEAIERTFLIFGEDRLTEARETWRNLGMREEVERHFWKQDGKKWIEAG